MQYQPRAERQFRDHLVRAWRSPAWTTPLARWVWTDGNSADAVVGGVATAGAYILSVVPASGATPIPIQFVRVAENNNQIAAGLLAAANTLLAVQAGGASKETVLRTFVQSASVSSATLSLIMQPGAPPFRLARTVPGAGTITIDPDDRFPINYAALGSSPVGPRTKFHITVVPVNNARVPLDPGGQTIDITARRMIDGELLEGVPTPVRVSSSESFVGLPLNECWTLEANGGRWCFELANLSGAIAGLYELEVWVREVTV